MRVSPARVALAAVLLALPATARAQVVDDFESYLLGTLPAPLWSDAGLVLPGANPPPSPSAYVISTTDAHGNATKAVTTVGNIADSKGIFTHVPISSFYSLKADVRVDRYADAPAFTTSDWAMEVTFGQNGVCNWACAPSAGIYASSLSQGWRLYVLTPTIVADIDLGAAATPGVWYTVVQTLDVPLGRFHSQVFDAATGTKLVDQVNDIAGWNPAEIQFDSFAMIGGDLSPSNTVGNIGVVDNVNVTATTPEPASLGLLALGLTVLGVWRRRRAV